MHPSGTNTCSTTNILQQRDLYPPSISKVKLVSLQHHFTELNNITCTMNAASAEVVQQFIWSAASLVKMNLYIPRTWCLSRLICGSFLRYIGVGMENRTTITYNNYNLSWWPLLVNHGFVMFILVGTAILQINCDVHQQQPHIPIVWKVSKV